MIEEKCSDRLEDLDMAPSIRYLAYYTIGMVLLPMALKYVLRKLRDREIKKDEEDDFNYDFLFTNGGHKRINASYEEQQIKIEADLNKILSFVSSAKSSVSICCNHLTIDSLVDLLIKMHKEKINIRVILDREMAKEYYKSSMIKLKRADIAVKTQLNVNSILHHKFILIDSDTDGHIMTGSMNLTNHALKSNFECVLFTNNPKIVNQFHKTFEFLWKTIDKQIK